MVDMRGGGIITPRRSSDLAFDPMGCLQGKADVREISEAKD